MMLLLSSTALSASIGDRFPQADFAVLTLVAGTSRLSPGFQHFQSFERLQFLMAQATIGQIDARLTEIDDVLFKVSTGQTIMSDAEVIAMQAEAGRIMTTLAAALGKAENVDPKFMYERRDKIRQL